MLIDDEWNGLADLLANLIAKYASELGIDGMPDASHNKEYNSDSKKYKTILYSRQKPGNSTEFPVDDDVLFIYNNLFY